MSAKRKRVTWADVEADIGCLIEEAFAVGYIHGKAYRSQDPVAIESAGYGRIGKDRADLERTIRAYAKAQPNAKDRWRALAVEAANTSLSRDAAVSEWGTTTLKAMSRIEAGPIRAYARYQRQSPVRRRKETK